MYQYFWKDKNARRQYRTGCNNSKSVNSMALSQVILLLSLVSIAKAFLAQKERNEEAAYLALTKLTQATECPG